MAMTAPRPLFSRLPVRAIQTKSLALSLSLSLFDARLPARRRGAAGAWSRAAHDRPALDGSLFAGFFPAQSP